MNLSWNKGFYTYFVWVYFFYFSQVYCGQVYRLYYIDPISFRLTFLPSFILVEYIVDKQGKALYYHRGTCIVVFYALDKIT